MTKSSSKGIQAPPATDLDSGIHESVGRCHPEMIYLDKPVLANHRPGIGLGNLRKNIVDNPRVQPMIIYSTRN